jgi:hypothetical protein
MTGNDFPKATIELRGSPFDFMCRNSLFIHRGEDLYEESCPDFITSVSTFIHG